MADKKFSQYDAGTPAGDDIVLLKDVSAGKTIRVTVSGLIVAAGAAIYPVGSIYINATSPANPNSLLGFGTWVPFGAGRVPVGYDSTQTEFNAAEKTSGAKTHTHDSINPVGYSSGVPYALASDRLQGHATSNGIGADTNITVQGTWGYRGTDTVGQSLEIHKITSTATSTLQPSITVYMWKRTA